MSNPFFDELDWAMRGKNVEVTANGGDTYRGVANRIDHSRGSILLHNGQKAVPGGPKENWEAVGSVFIRNVATMHVLADQHARTKSIAYPHVDDIEDSPYYDADVEPPDAHLRSAYRNGFTGSFPVVRRVKVRDEDGFDVDRYELINGHKRIEACRRVGLERHPVEVIECTDEEAKELVHLAHREMFEDDGRQGRDLTFYREAGDDGTNKYVFETEAGTVEADPGMTVSELQNRL